MISSKKGKQKYIRNYCFCLSERSKKINKTVFSTSSKKAKTSELFLKKYIKITKALVKESHHQICPSFTISILYYCAVDKNN